MACQPCVQSESGGVCVLVETPLKGTVGLWHVAVAYRLCQLFAQIVLVSQVKLHLRAVSTPCGVAEYLEMVYPLVRQ